MAPKLHRLFLPALAASGLAVGPALAADQLVTIGAPAEGAKLAAGKASKLDYEVQAGTKAHHVHLFVDGGEVGTAHKLKGSFALPALKPGEHKICVAPVNTNHTPIGEKACISVTAE